jgi:glycosyltransferase involved in cell wall biosynthesis
VIERVPEDQVMREYRRHDALLFTSTYEGFGLVLIEAMSQRLPVIATPAGCASALVTDGETGYRVPPRDASALASAIRAAIGNPLEARRRAENAHRQVQGMTWRATAEQTLALYEKTLHQVRHRPR